LVNLKDNLILEVMLKGVCTASNFYELDVLMLATAFDSVIDGLTQFNIKDIDGQSLKFK